MPHDKEMVHKGVLMSSKHNLSTDVCADDKTNITFPEPEPHIVSSQLSLLTSTLRLRRQRLLW